MFITCTFDQSGRIAGWYVGHPLGKPAPVQAIEAATNFRDLTTAMSVSRLMEIHCPGSSWGVIGREHLLASTLLRSVA